MPRARVKSPLADLLGARKDPAFERLAGLAAKVLDAPMAMVTLIDGPHLHALGRVGPPDLGKPRRTPVKDTFCRHAVAAGETLIVDDAREHELTKGLAVVKSGKALAYAGSPLRLGSGAVVGTLCVADSRPRAWKREEIALLEDLALSVRTELETRADLEARRRAETELQRADDRLRGLMDNSPAAICALDLKGQLLFSNPAAEVLLGGRRGLTADDEAVIAGGAPVESEEALEGDAVHHTVRFPLTDEAGEPYGICRISTDVTERKQTEAALREAQQRFVSAFEHAPTGMAMVGTDGRFRQVNAALCELTGRSEAELLKVSLAAIVHPDEWAARKRLFERMLTGEIRTHQTQGRLVTGAGEARWTMVSATALTDDGGWPSEFFVQFQDVTEQARGQQLLGARHDVTRALAQAATVEQAAPLLLELELRDAVVSPEPEPAGPEPVRAEVTVLVVDDNAVNRMVAAEMLRQRGYRVEVAKDGEEAVAAAAAESFGVILMDCHMPVMDGYDATRAIRAAESDGPHVAIVAMTSDTVDSVRDACFDAGMDDYLAKPVTGDALAGAIERWRPADARSDLDLGVLTRLTEETGGARDSELIKSLAGLFREDSKRGLEQVADALREKDAQGVARAAHALKGSSGQLGATRTEAISAELQAVAETGELGDAKALLRRLETAVDAAQSALSSALPDGAPK